MIFGVSPAYFISRFGEGFTCEQIAGSLGELSAMGFGGFQLEVFLPDRLSEWTDGGAALVRARADEAELTATQFVAHFMLEGFASPSSLQSDFGFQEAEEVVRIMKQFPRCDLVTLPLPAWQARSADAYSTAAVKRARSRLAEKLSRIGDIFHAAGVRMALEIMPGSLAGGTEGVLALWEEMGDTRTGYNFDTGHAWACKENIYAIPARFGTRITGTHLCDNAGLENLSAPPGDGTIDWNLLMKTLAVNGYRGAYDIEIRCDASEVEAAYVRGLSHLKERVNTGEAAGSSA